jgi:hypothetical protein
MIHRDSPLRNLPVGIGAEQSFFLDGMRHAAELCELSYSRLTKQLSELSHAAEKDEIPTTYATYYLDAWAFVDSCDKYVGLWIKQPKSSTLPTHFSPETVRKALQPIRKIRNISDHLASNKKKLLELNSASFGILSWIVFFERNPPKTKTYAIYPGVLRDNVKLQFSMPNSIDQITNDIGHVSLRAAKHSADLTSAYKAVRNLTAFLEQRLRQAIGGQNFTREDVYPCDLLAKAVVHMQRSEISPNKGFNRTQESAGPDNPGKRGGGAG